MAELKIIPQRCKACNYCIKFCPKNVLEIGKEVNSQGYEYVVAERMKDCIACCICGRICPEGAIEIYN